MQKEQKAAILLGALILAISLGIIPTIAMDALAAYIQCRPAQSSCTGTSSGDSIFETDGADNISGLGGGDSIIAKSGNDVVSGGSGGDGIIGGSGADTLNGGAGNDVLDGGAGDDNLTGGPGADEFDCGDGTDTVVDYNEDEGDTVEENCENV